MRTPASRRRLLIVGRTCCFWLLTAGLLSTCVATRADASDRRSPIVRAIEGVKDSVVNIHGQKTLGPEDPAAAHGDAPHRVNGMGTGVVIDERGYIITNFHVVDGVQKIEVTLPTGASYVAQLESSDPTADLAVIKINAGGKLPVAKIGTSSDLMVGETVIAIGNAYGYENTVSDGIISALHRSVQVSDAQGYDDLIQVTSPINPGNSGGPLINIDGELVGINVAVRAGAQNIGFAIPVDRAMTVAAKLMSVEKLDSHWHGISPQESAAATSGFVVGEVEKESPAADVGLKTGDVITAVGKQDVARPLDFERALLGRKVGEEVSLTVRRDDKPVKMSLVLAALPERSALDADLAWDMLGLKLTTVSAAQFKTYQSRYRGGLSITDVRPDSPAAKQGLKRGDVLVGMHIWETVTLENVNYILTRSDLGDIEPMKFYILRGNETLYGHFNVSLKKPTASRE